jgi:hypothetical protein
VLVVAALALAGCSDDSPTDVAGNNGGVETGVFRVDIAGDEVDFEIISQKNGDPDDPIEGPFAIRGSNIRYEEGALVVDLSVVNLGEDTFHEPVMLTFLSLLPGGVEVLNPDNDEPGNGAAIVFEFENDDDRWTPREESLGRETRFDAEEGLSIGFIARLDTGSGMPTLGAIGGMVWDDENEDGIMDEGEAGVAGAEIALAAEGMETVTTMTGEDGTYRFDDLAPGFYEVMKMPVMNMHATTPTKIYVVLVDDGGMVVSFLAANFGCLEQPSEPTAIIKGKVWDDQDGNGMQNDGEPGLEGAAVALGLGATATTTTAADGSYAFIDLMAGDYLVTSTGPDGWEATTNSELQITLAADDEVYDEASFGWRAPIVE